jgi:hypothetical protein
MTPQESSVLHAALKWASRLEARVKADEEAVKQTEAEEGGARRTAGEALADAEIDLYAAVLALRG